MYAQLTYFDGPRTPELVAAADRAGRERIERAIMARSDLRVVREDLLVEWGGRLVGPMVPLEQDVERAVP